MIKVDDEKLMDDLDVSKNFLYGYLRRSGKIVTW
jgi:hypothetical protein